MWNEQTARLFACDCAEHVLHIFEASYPNDKRPRHAIETARRFARGEATNHELIDAASAAWDAAKNAAYEVAWAASEAAEAIGDVCWAADAAARDARQAAMTNAIPSAKSITWSAEKAWQAERKRWYLEE